MNKVILGLLFALNLINLATSTLTAQETPKNTTEPTGIADLKTKLELYRAEKPVESTCVVWATSGFTTGSTTYAMSRLLSKTKPKGLVGLATTAGLCVGTLTAIKFSGDNLAHLRSLQITELQKIKTQAHTVSTGLSDLITEHSLVKNLIDKVHSLAGRNQKIVQTELQKSKELADLIAKTSNSVDQLGADVTKQALELEHILSRHLDASYKTQLARELTIAQTHQSSAEYPIDKR